MTEDWYPPVSPLAAGLGCKCPRCGRGRLYAGLLNVAPRCDSCGLNLAEHDTGDGPAVFVILILGFIVVGLALWVELAYEPPFWVHAVLWVPLIALGAPLMLRVFKATLIALHYKHRREDYDSAA
ncbi:MAG: DUF983 domain-containing protein [Rhodospirillaceae bacterium]|nr:DUF983 domain-containing protein [Rhodospirillaceae bacterium]